MTRIEKLERLESITSKVFYENCFILKERLVEGRRVMVSVFVPPSKEKRDEIFNILIPYARKDNPDETLQNIKSDCSDAIKDYLMMREIQTMK